MRLRSKRIAVSTNAESPEFASAESLINDGSKQYNSTRRERNDMTETSIQPYGPRTNWVRLQTLVVLRWIAILGQFSAIVVAQRLFGLDLNLGLCLLAIGASVAANLLAITVYPRAKRLSEAEVAGMLAFDMLQLALLIFLTGGLNNPFALLIIAPVAIAAMTLSARAAAGIALLAVALAACLLFWHFPLQTLDGAVMQMPRIFAYGFLVAIVIGVLFLSVYASRVTGEMQTLSEALAATQLALSREQKLTDLGGVVAAAAHELGTPLATIKLASSELLEELHDNPMLQDDAILIRDQADRCRDILSSMGRAGKDDLHVHHAPISAVIRESAEPHADRGKKLHYEFDGPDATDARQPTIDRRPEIIHGLRNLIQNAVDFARANVWIDVSWNDEQLVVRIVDDGPGYSSTVVSQIGEPYMIRRKRDSRLRYEGMGLGMFIAKTLLERTGAELRFSNGREYGAPDNGPGERTGAIADVRWSREAFADAGGAERAPLGQNRQIRA